MSKGLQAGAIIGYASPKKLRSHTVNGGFVAESRGVGRQWCGNDSKCSDQHIAYKQGTRQMKDRVCGLGGNEQRPNGGFEGMLPNPSQLSFHSNKGISVALDKCADEEVVHNVSLLSELGLIGRFCGLWPSLSELYAWISESWGSLLKGSVQIYPATKWFFIVVFENTQDRKMVLCDHLWCWDERHALMLKPWHPNFRPDSEGFDKTPLWVRLPYFPLHLWFDSCLESIGNALGDFLMVDDDSSNLLHSTYARMLVEIDLSQGLPAEIEINSSKGSWLQPLDYEGIPFRCRRCHQVGHMASKCSKMRTQKDASWWKDSDTQHYTVEKHGEKGEKQQSFAQIVAESPKRMPTEVIQNVSQKQGGNPSKVLGEKGMLQIVQGVDALDRGEKGKQHGIAAAPMDSLENEDFQQEVFHT